MTRTTAKRADALVWVLAFGAWFVFALIAVAGGIVRVTILEPRLGSYPANVVETLALVVVLLVLIWIAVPWLLPELRTTDLIKLGAFWFGLTVAFEFLFGHYVDGATWDALLANYDITAGRLWILVLLSMGLGPIILGRARSQAPHAGA
jgi:hypothetical protein